MHYCMFSRFLDLTTLTTPRYINGAFKTYRTSPLCFRMKTEEAAHTQEIRLVSIIENVLLSSEDKEFARDYVNHDSLSCRIYVLLPFLTWITILVILHSCLQCGWLCLYS